MKLFITFTVSLLLTVASFGQQDLGRFFVRVQNSTAPELIDLLNAAGFDFEVLRILDFPNLQLNALSILIPEEQVNALNNFIQDIDNGGRVVRDLPAVPDDGTGDDPKAPFQIEPFGENPALNFLVPEPADAQQPCISGQVVINVVGTGIDQAHPDLNGLNFLQPISVIPDGGGGVIPADVDLHNHETRVVSCIGGMTNGLLQRLGGGAQPAYRSVLCYEAPTGSASVAFVSDCIFAIAEVLTARDQRLSQPYLKNHASVICFAHSLETLGSRVGDLEQILDEAWESGIVTVISAGNRNAPAAANSPSGAGEWLVLTRSGTPRRYWPLPGGLSYLIPSGIGFDGRFQSSAYHIKAGAHDGSQSPARWVVSSSLGSNYNDLNPSGFSPVANDGVDLYAPGKDIPCASTRAVTPPVPGNESVVIAGTKYSLERGYQLGNGTSYSAGFASALAARILILNPWASPAQVRQKMEDFRLKSGGIASFDLMTVPIDKQLEGLTLTYAQWIARYVEVAPFGFFNGGLAGKFEDSDEDGILNIVEYLCGMDPRYKDADLAPKITFDEANNRLEMHMHSACYLPEESEVSWRIESSSNLKNPWTSRGKGSISVLSEQSQSGDGRPIRSRIALTFPTDEEFFRVRISN